MIAKFEKMRLPNDDLARIEKIMLSKPHYDDAKLIPKPSLAYWLIFRTIRYVSFPFNGLYYLIASWSKLTTTNFENNFIRHYYY